MSNVYFLDGPGLTGTAGLGGQRMLGPNLGTSTSDPFALPGNTTMPGQAQAGIRPGMVQSNIRHPMQNQNSLQQGVCILIKNRIGS